MASTVTVVYLFLPITLRNFTDPFLHRSTRSRTCIFSLMVLNFNVIAIFTSLSFQLGLQCIFPDRLNKEIDSPLLRTTDSNETYDVFSRSW